MGKRAEWEALIQTMQPDFIHATETWLEPSTSSAEFLPNGYAVYRKDRPADKHGGVFLAYRKDLPVKHIEDLETDGEILWCQLDIRGKRPILLGTVYKPKHDDIESVDHLCDNLDKISNSTRLRDVVIHGDFNQPNIDWRTKATIPNHSASKATADRMLELIQIYGLTQHVKEPTRLKNILDLVLTNNSTLVEETAVVPGPE